MAEKTQSQPLFIEENEQLAVKVWNHPCLNDKAKKNHIKKNACLHAWAGVCSELDILENG